MGNPLWPIYLHRRLFRSAVACRKTSVCEQTDLRISGLRNQALASPVEAGFWAASSLAPMSHFRSSGSWLSGRTSQSAVFSGQLPDCRPTANWPTKPTSTRRIAGLPLFAAHIRPLVQGRVEFPPSREAVADAMRYPRTSKRTELGSHRE